MQPGGESIACVPASRECGEIDRGPPRPTSHVHCDGIALGRRIVATAAAILGATSEAGDATIGVRSAIYALAWSGAS